MSWEYLTTVPEIDEVFGPFSVMYLIVFIAGLIASAFVYNRPRIFSSRHLLRRSDAKLWAVVLIWIFALGLFFFLVRWLQINPFGFGQRLWLYLTLSAAIIAIALLVLQIRVSAPRLAEQAREERAAHMRGLGNRRPPKRNRSRKR